MAFKGIETKRFNNIISQKISENNNDIDLELDTINFKIDIKNFSLFLETKNPNIFYKNVTIPARNIKVYINFLSFIKNETTIEKITININQLDVNDLKKLSKSFKPSKFK